MATLKVCSRVFLVVWFWGSVMGTLQASSLFFEEPQDSFTGTWNAEVQTRHFAHSNIQPVREVLNGSWNLPFRKQPPLLFFYQKSLIIAYTEGVSLGLVRQREALFQGNDDLRNVFHFSQTTKNLPEGKMWKVKGSLEGYEFQGPHIGYFHKSSEIQWMGGISLLHGIELQQINLKGEVRRLPLNEGIQVDVLVEQYYSNNRLYDQSLLKKIQGLGLSLDGWISKRFSPVWTGYLGFQDVGAIDWHWVPYGKVSGHSKPARIQNKIEPTLEGTETQKKRLQPLFVKLGGGLMGDPLSIKPWKVRFQWDYAYGQQMPSVDAIYQQGEGQILMGYQLVRRTVIMGVSHRWGFLRIESDSLDWGKSYSSGLFAGIFVGL